MVIKVKKIILKQDTGIQFHGSKHWVLMMCTYYRLWRRFFYPYLLVFCSLVRIHFFFISFYSRIFHRVDSDYRGGIMIWYRNSLERTFPTKMFFESSFSFAKGICPVNYELKWSKDWHLVAAESSGRLCGWVDKLNIFSSAERNFFEQTQNFFNPDEIECKLCSLKFVLRTEKRNCITQCGMKERTKNIS